MQVKFKKLNQAIGVTLPAPAYATSGAAGIDLAASLTESMVVAPRARVFVPTGLAVDMPDVHMVGLVFPRSGLASKYGLALANAVGVIDSDYKGEIICAIQNNSEVPYEIKPGDRIAQLVFIPCCQVDIAYTDELTPTARSSGGFGSTGK